MFSLLKGDCEHCGQTYRYSLLDSEFSDCSYAYCDTCGRLATVSYSSSFLLSMPPTQAPHQVIDEAWEAFLRPCECGGHFRRSAAPRCVVCVKPLSAEYAAEHIQRNFITGNRTWHWQGNWSDKYCIIIEDPKHPGRQRLVTNPFLDAKSKAELVERESGSWFGKLFKSSK
jgi:hypothetical protein